MAVELWANNLQLARKGETREMHVRHHPGQVLVRPWHPTPSWPLALDCQYSDFVGEEAVQAWRDYNVLDRLRTANRPRQTFFVTVPAQLFFGKHAPLRFRSSSWGSILSVSTHFLAAHMYFAQVYGLRLLLSKPEGSLLWGLRSGGLRRICRRFRNSRGWL